MLSTIAATLRALNWINWLLAAILILFLCVLLANFGGLRDGILAGIEGDMTEGAHVYEYLLSILLLALPGAVAVHLILTRLAALVRDTAAGTAFSSINASRLRTIGWALLGINIADLFFGWMSVRTSAVTGEYFGWSISFTGWIAVPMLFVLAQVFLEGARMREDLEGTV